MKAIVLTTVLIVLVLLGAQAQKQPISNSKTVIKQQSKIPSDGLMQKSKRIDKRVPEFNLTDLDGNSISSENTKGKVVVLNFWFTTCKPCIEEIPELNKVYQKYKSNPDVVFAAVTLSNKQLVDQFLKTHTLNWPVITDQEQCCKDFEIRGFPTNVVIGKDGKYSDILVGGRDDIATQLSLSIEEALTQKKIKRKAGRQIQITPDSKFKSEDGTAIEFSKAIELLKGGEYRLKQQKETDGTPYFQLIKK